ncbi:MAG: HEAT repeat domain-containing protein [Pirellulales bacterium]|jgi:hypothetical protein
MDNKQILAKLSSNDANEIYDIVIDIGKEELREYSSNIFNLLDHPESEARRAAIWTLGIRWQIPEAIPKLASIWMSDVDELVRTSALIAWSGFYSDSRSHEKASKLLEIVKEDKEELLVMIEAIRGIYKIAGCYTAEVRKRVDGIRSLDAISTFAPIDELNQLVTTLMQD